MQTAAVETTTYEALDGTRRTACCGEHAGQCSCNDPDREEKRRIVNALRKHPKWSVQPAEILTSFPVAALRNWRDRLDAGDYDRKKKVPKSRAAKPKATKTKATTTKTLEPAPPSIMAAAERARPEIESDFPMVQAFGVARVRRAAAEHRHQQARESGRDFRLELVEESRFQVAKEQLESPSLAVRQLAEKNLRRLAADPPASRKELIAALRGSKVREFVTDQDLADCSIDSLRRLASEKDTLAGTGYSVGTVKATAKQARADRKRSARKNR